jgi:hypothetical protein
MQFALEIQSEWAFFFIAIYLLDLSLPLALIQPVLEDQKFYMAKVVAFHKSSILVGKMKQQKRKHHIFNYSSCLQGKENTFFISFSTQLEILF